jgi:hypothetical protein
MGEQEQSEEIIALKLQMQHLQEQMKELQSSVNTVVNLMTQAKGGWRLIVGIGTVFGGLYAILISLHTLWSKFAPFFMAHPPVGK